MMFGRGSKSCASTECSPVKRDTHCIDKSRKCERLVRSRLGLFCRLDADAAALASPVLKLHDARDHSIQRVVAAAANVFSWLMLSTAIKQQNRARIDEIPAEAHDT